MEISKILKSSWNITKNHWVHLFVMGLPTALSSFFAWFFGILYGRVSSLGSFIGLFLFLFSLYMGTSLTMGYANSIKTGDYSFSQAFIAFNKKYDWPLLSFITLIISLGIYLGGMFFLVPGIILSLGWSTIFYQYQEAIEEKKEITFIGSFKSGWDLMKGYKLSLFLVSLTFGVIVLLSTLIFGLISGLASHVNIPFFTIISSILSIVFVIEMIVISVWGSVARYVFYEEIKGLNKVDLNNKHSTFK